MREIKFRAWDIKNNKWLVLSGVTVSFPLPVPYPNDGNVTLAISSFDPSNIWMQYTGLKDKNDVGIYEGDIVTTNCPEYQNMNDHWVIEFGHTGMFQLSAIPMRGFKQSIHDLIYNKWHMEVIGNVHQNPELLNGNNS